MSASLRRSVIQRAQSRCEYCQLSQEGQEATFHIDHVTPIANGGQTVAENLALACVSYSLRKAAHQVAIGPETSTDAPIYDPKGNGWQEHVRWKGVHILGLTPTGRATIEALDMNRPLILSIRYEETLLSRHPPSTIDA